MRRIACYAFGLAMLGTASLSIASLADGLILYLPFDEGAGDVATDWSGNGFDGNIDGASWTEGQLGGALESSGEEFVEVPYDAAFDVADGVTLAAWVTANVPFDPEWRSIINGGLSTYGPYLLQTGAAANAELGMHSGGQGAWTWLRTVQSLEADVFHHVVGVYDVDNGLHIYFDGIPDDGAGSPGNAPGPIDPTSQEGIYVGQAYMGGRGWDGVIDEVAVYNRALTEAEAADLYAGPPVAQAVDADGKLATTWGRIKTR